MKRAALVAALLGAVALPAAADSQDMVVDRFQVQPAGRAITELTIENPLGDVRVEGYDGKAIQIETHKRGPKDVIDRLRVSLVANPNGAVHITSTAEPRKPEDPAIDRSGVRIDMIILAPHDVRVDATVNAGTLELVKMDRGGELDSASGKIIVRNVAGDLATHTVTGNTTLTQVFGSIDAQSISSNLDLDSITGDRLVAAANDGQITGRRVRSRYVELTTTNGRIRFEGEVALHGRMIVASLKGDLDVRLRRNGAVILRAPRGAKLNLGTTTARNLPDGSLEAQLGTLAASVQPALVELRSRYANVHFAIIE